MTPTEHRTRFELARRDLGIARKVRRYVIPGLTECTALLSYHRPANIYYLSILSPSGRYRQHLEGTDEAIQHALVHLYSLSAPPGEGAESNGLE